MKKQTILWSLLLTAGFFLNACKDTGENKSEMKTPVDAARTPSGSSLTVAEAKTKTIADLQEAFSGESNATARYAAFSKKAAEEGYKEIALLFKAASLAEKVHAGNHKAVLEEMGIAVTPAKIEVKVLSTKENLEFAIKGETYEATTMYPNFLKDADAAGNQLALISLNYAYKTEKKHKAFYEQALAALTANKLSSLPSVYFVCPTCGNTYETAAPKRCGISMTSGEKFIKINTL
ncbi:rubrerythrin family protein [Chryseobacterium sp.]|uniref:rubrerythrin family protein n=1 Tax=Chryseobacterium sp. TaxID=1871047 RepID=UPI001E38BA0D|nr:ferritin family protein [Chryseobacterium sp.]